MLILSCLNLIVAPIDCSPGPNSGSQSGSVVKENHTPTGSHALKLSLMMFLTPLVNFFLFCMLLLFVLHFILCDSSSAVNRKFDAAFSSPGAAGGKSSAKSLKLE
ncbi:hypothetical protein P8452_13237 [Trifolium repens]|nr:hypothetical protein P8452_13237 [Trifolium repens]